MGEQIKRITIKQAIFAREIAKGVTQRQACIIAYPNTKKWTLKAIDVRASNLMKNKTVKEELQRLNKKNEEKILWNKEIATKAIIEVIEANREELDRLLKTYDDVIQSKEDKIDNLKIELREVNNDMEKSRIEEELDNTLFSLLNFKKQSFINEENVKAILQGVRILNKMYGLNNLNDEDIIENEKIMSPEELQELADEIINQNK